MSAQFDWKTVELLGYHYFSQKGYNILVKLVSNNSYDFVAEKDGVFIRVNVKCAGLKTKGTPTSWAISQASSNTTFTIKETSDVDVYLVWLPHQERFIELSGDFFIGSRSKSKLIPKNLLEGA